MHISGWIVIERLWLMQWILQVFNDVSRRNMKMPLGNISRGDVPEIIEREMLLGMRGAESGIGSVE